MNLGFRELLDIDVSECPPAEFMYRFLADKIEKLIFAGDLPKDVAFPGERDLADMLKVSVGTVRRVVRELRERGVVTTVRSKGTYAIPANKRPGNRPQPRSPIAYRA